MTEDSDTSSSVSEVVPSPSMETLNDELTPEADKPQQELAVSRTNTPGLLARFGSFLGITESKGNVETESPEDLLARKVSQLTKDLDDSRREVAIVNEQLEAIKAGFDRFKRESDATTSRMAEMQNEIKSWKTDAEWKFRIIQLENEETSVKIDTKPKTIEIRTTFTEVSKLTVFCDYSQPIEVAGIVWKVGVRKSLLLHNGVAFCLNGEKNNAFKWACRMLVEFRLISPKSKKLDDVRRMELIYDANIGYRNFTGISFKDLRDKGYLENDSIDVDVVIRVFPIN